MKQILQNLKSGETIIADVPSPKLKNGHLKIRTKKSLISPGTEGMIVGFSKSNYIEKARQQPDKVKQVINKIKNDGLKPTYDAVMSRLDEMQPLGYSNVGEVIEVGSEVEGFKIGDRVVSNGRHAEVVCVPKNLCIKIPNEVSDEDAAFTVISSIALQGVRLSLPTLGESFLVYGLGLIGLITAQILKANGCHVIGVDVSEDKINKAIDLGIDAHNLSGRSNLDEYIKSLNHENEIDGVIITASAKDNSIISNSAKVCRKRGRIILVGVVGLDIDRSDFYEKEISFQVSCSYGPGRYDDLYEQNGVDYPIGFVRWTENRNFKAILEMIKNKSLKVDTLISKKEKLINADKLYDEILSGKFITALIDYDSKETNHSNVIRQNKERKYDSNKPIIAVIGAGNFTKNKLLPSIKKYKENFHTIASSEGISSFSSSIKYNFSNNSNKVSDIFENQDINTVFVMTRHDSHADLVTKSLENNKNVFVEKPLCIKEEDLQSIENVYNQNQNLKLMVGFNRRFSRFSQYAKSVLSSRSKPVSLIYTVNAGYLPSSHWAQSEDMGGGRIIGEACHFIDLCSFVIGSPVIEVSAHKISHDLIQSYGDDIVTINLTFIDGSIASIHYFANGSKEFSKERIEIFNNGEIISIDNFKSIKINSKRKPHFLIPRIKAIHWDSMHFWSLLRWAKNLQYLLMRLYQA